MWVSCVLSARKVDVRVVRFVGRFGVAWRVSVVLFFFVVLWAWAVSIFPGARAGSGLCVTLFLFFPRLDLSVVFLGLRW